MSEPKKLQVYGKFGGGLKTVNGLGPDENGNVEVFNDETEALTLVVEMGLVDPVTDENGAIFVDDNGAILTL